MTFLNILIKNIPLTQIICVFFHIPFFYFKNNQKLIILVTKVIKFIQKTIKLSNGGIIAIIIQFVLVLFGETI